MVYPSDSRILAAGLSLRQVRGSTAQVLAGWYRDDTQETHAGSATYPGRGRVIISQDEEDSFLLIVNFGYLAPAFYAALVHGQFGSSFEQIPMSIFAVGIPFVLLVNAWTRLPESLMFGVSIPRTDDANINVYTRIS